MAAPKWIPQNVLDELSNPDVATELFYEYVTESTHGSWEGFTSSDVEVIRRFLMDYVLYVTYAKEDYDE